jgi:hypothetical protein
MRSHRRFRTSPHAISCRPWLGRQAVAWVLLIISTPSLLLNVGAGRGVLVHDHDDVPIHTHVVTIQDPHRHLHVHEHEYDGGDSATPLPTDDSDQHDQQGTVVRGTEVASSKRQHAATEVASLHADLFNPIPANAAPSLYSPSLPDSSDSPAGTHLQHLVCLRAVVLLI